MNRIFFAVALAVTTSAAAQVTTPWVNGVSYTYDAAGNITRIGTDAYRYDSADRLVSGAVTGRERRYEYDAFGNRTSCIDVNSGGVCQPVTIAAATNRISGATYDAAGNVTHFAGDVFAHDSAGMLQRDLSLAGTREYVYTADDERVAVIRGSQWTWTLRDLSAKVLREMTSTAGDGGTHTNWQWARDNVWRDHTLLASRQAVGGTVTTWHYHTDHLGTPRVVSNEAGIMIGDHDYFPFGLELSGNVAEPSENPHKFTGHERDQSGGNAHPLDYMHARYYSAGWGRFLSVDPVLGDVFEPQSWNRYAYVMNNPLRYSDPRGLQPCPVVGSDGVEREGECIDVEAPEDEPAPEIELGPSDEVLRWLDERWYAVHDIRNPVTGMTLGQHATATANFAVGFGDASSLGLTALFRDEEDAQNVDSESLAYTAGIVAGTANSYAYNRIGYTKGYEFTRNPKLFRLAPWGNRTGHATGRYPHYHLKRPGPGGSIKRHRPWDTRKTDKSFWSRFW